MRYNNITILSISLIITGVLFILRFLGIINIPFTVITSYVFIIYGIITVYFSIGTGYRGRLFFASAIFLCGVMMYVTNNYEILKPSSAIFSAVIFISGSCFLILFVDNPKEKTFLYSGIILLLISYFSITLFKDSSLIQTANSLSNLVMDFWPVFLMLFGINILLMRKR